MLSNSQIKREAKAALSGNWGVAIGVYVVYVVLMAVASSFIVGSLLLGGVLAFGLSSAFLCVVRTKRMAFETLFGGFNNFGTTCVAGILQGIYTFLWSLLFIIPGIVKAYSYSMTYYIIQDNPNISANDAITESRKMMIGHKWKLFCLDLSFIGWLILVGLTFGILALYVSPYMNAAHARFYEDIKNGTPAQA